MVTIKDIAAKCGVSTALVSKALNNYPDVKETTKQRVLQEAQEMGYFPNSNARNLAKSKTDKIGVVIRANEESRFIDEINMIYAYSTFKKASELGFDISLVFTEVFKNKSDIEISNYLKSEGITGVILFGLSLKEDKMMSIFKDDFFKKVLLDIPIINPNTSSVTIDNIDAQYSIIDMHYRSNIHKKICYLSGPIYDIASNERKKGIELFMYRNPDVQVDFFCGEYRDDVSYTIAQQNPDYDAYICANDMMAIGVNTFFKDKKERPLITGFDGIKLLDYIEPAFPTIVQNFHEKSELAVESLVRLFNGEDSETTLVDYRLDVRK